MNKEEVINKILEFPNNADYKRLSCDEIAILKDYITNLEKENRILKEKIKTDIDLLKNYEFDKYDWNYMEQQAVAEYLEKEILNKGE